MKYHGRVYEPVSKARHFSSATDLALWLNEALGCCTCGRRIQLQKNLWPTVRDLWVSARVSAARAGRIQKLVSQLSNAQRRRLKTRKSDADRDNTTPL